MKEVLVKNWLYAPAIFDCFMISERVIPHSPQDYRNLWVYDHDFCDRCQASCGGTEPEKIDTVELIYSGHLGGNAFDQFTQMHALLRFSSGVSDH